MNQVTKRREIKIQKALDNQDWDTISKLLNQPYENSKRKDRANHVLYLNHINNSLEGNTYEFGDNIASSIYSPLESLLLKETQITVNKKLALLNKTDYAIIVGFYLEKKSYSQLSRETGLSDKTIKKRLTKVTIALKKSLKIHFM
ncbi:hypothetical protein AOB58_2551 [Staphylococcus sp. AntiMn-1]|uniref:RNA polymerase sigma factor n=1 Tax=Staphylococcus sp. AntiMn-1 TaxID=1715860 RepID=UPI0007EB67E1|nr:sigma-70 family RNA polymerase sigma factor [Staphylococcus sp. AntiMn-1]ANK39353.1 hypothetical protein AOB58_2551 [Staphylococcus sp. AntiMn-1]